MVVRGTALALLDLDAATGVATLRIGMHPVVSWVWSAGGVVAVGGALVLVVRSFARRATELRSRDRLAVVASESLVDGVGR